MGRRRRPRSGGSGGQLCSPPSRGLIRIAMERQHLTAVPRWPLPCATAAAPHGGEDLSWRSLPACTYHAEHVASARASVSVHAHTRHVDASARRRCCAHLPVSRVRQRELAREEEGDGRREEGPSLLGVVIVHLEHGCDDDGAVARGHARGSVGKSDICVCLCVAPARADGGPAHRTRTRSRRRGLELRGRSS